MSTILHYKDLQGSLDCTYPNHSDFRLYIRDKIISMSTLQNIIALLDSHNLQYTIRHHEATYTSEQSAMTRGESLSTGAKAIVYKVQNDFHLFVMAADKKMDTKQIKAFFMAQGLKAKKTRFATEEELLEQTGLVSGSVPPFGKPILPYQLHVDPSLLENKQISFNAGSLTDSITLTLDDYMSIADANVFQFTAL